MQYDIIRRISSAAHILQHDVENGFQELNSAIGFMALKEPERAEMFTQKLITFLLGVTDEVRYFVVERMIEMKPSMERPDMAKMSAKATFEKRLASMPNTPAGLLDDVEEKEPETQIIKIVSSPEDAIAIIRSIIGEEKRRDN